jgi:hypothetical protein
MYGHISLQKNVRSALSMEAENRYDWRWIVQRL